MTNALVTLITVIYFGAAAALLLYGMNCYVLIFLFRRRRKSAERKRLEVLDRIGDPMTRDDLPVVTTQIPFFNEYNVAERIIDASGATPSGNPGSHSSQSPIAAWKPSSIWIVSSGVSIGASASTLRRTSSAVTRVKNWYQEHQPVPTRAGTRASISRPAR